MDLPIHTQIVEHINTAVLLVNDHLGLEYINPAAELLLGVSSRRIHGIRFDALVHCEGSPFQERISEHLLVGRPYTEREVKIRLRDGRLITVNCTVTPILDSPLAPAALLELVQLDRHLRISQEEQWLSQHSAARKMIRGLAHEIKNPLGGLRGAAQLLDGELREEALKEYTRIIIAEADRLHKLVDRMLGPNNRLHEQEINIHEILEHVRNLVLAEAPQGIELIRDYDPSLPWLWGDRDLLIQAVLNIVRNALQALGDRGRITLRTRILHKFTIGHTRHRRVIRADIVDNGPGIPKALQDTLFYPMVTGRDEGTGLGLTIAQTLINQHRGLIECQSRPGHTVFTVLLPIVAAHPEDEHA
jgi:two-component system nitrogen regulation sensor histidine kinase GlnL